MDRLALVLSAGGARGAYEAGVMYYIRTGLPKKVAHRQFEIQTGSSVGAINTVGIAAYAHDPKLQGERLKELWFSIRQENIYRRDISATKHFLGSTVGGIMRNFLTVNPFNIAKRGGPHFNSFLDTTPLREFIQKVVPWKQLNQNILKGPIDAVAISVTNIGNGQTELFLQKKAKVSYDGHYKVRQGPLRTEYILASGAIPIIFPTVKIDQHFYTDGGVKLFTPMSPAVQLGANRLIVIGLRKRRAPFEQIPTREISDKKPPTISDQMGKILNGLFLDRVQSDIEQLERINSIIECSEKVYGPKFLEKINQQMKKDDYSTDIAARGLRRIDCVEIQPSVFIHDLFLDSFERLTKKKFKFSVLEKTMLRLLDMDPKSGSDLLSYITFAPDYIRDLFDLGYEDAKAQRKRLIDILDQ